MHVFSRTPLFQPLVEEEPRHGHPGSRLQKDCAVQMLPSMRRQRYANV
jgi:hypothetical protein